MQDEALQLKGAISFPCHPKRKAMVYAGATGKASHQCPQCGAIAVFDYDSMTSEPSKMIRGASHRFATNNIADVSPSH